MLQTIKSMDENDTDAGRYQTNPIMQCKSENNRVASGCYPECKSKMAGAGFPCPLARFSSCKHFLSRNSVFCAKGCETACSRHVSRCYSLSRTRPKLLSLPQLLSTINHRNYIIVQSSPLTWRRTAIRHFHR